MSNHEAGPTSLPTRCHVHAKAQCSRFASSDRASVGTAQVLALADVSKQLPHEPAERSIRIFMCHSTICFHARPCGRGSSQTDSFFRRPAATLFHSSCRCLQATSSQCTHRSIRIRPPAPRYLALRQGRAIDRSGGGKRASHLHQIPEPVRSMSSSCRSLTTAERRNQVS